MQTSNFSDFELKHFFNHTFNTLSNFIEEYWMLGAALLLIILPAFLPSTALAADLTAIGITPAPDTDVSVQGINQIFGLSGVNPEYNVLGGIMSVWNASMMFVGSILVGYIILAGVLKTAHEGQALGQQWNSMWIPIRASMGLMLTAPVLAGYCTIQLLVIWASVQGVGLADMMWGQAAHMLAKNGGFVSEPITTDKSYEVIEKLYVSETCMISKNNRIAEERQSNAGVASAKIEPIPYGSTAMGDFGLKFGDRSGSYSETECGDFRWTSADQAAANSFANNNFKSVNGGGLFGLGAGFNALSGQVMENQRNAILASLNVLDPVIRTRLADVGSNTAPRAAQILPALNIYNETIASSVKNMTSFLDKSGLKTFGDDASKDGWALAGSYYSKIGAMNAAANDIIKTAPGGTYEEISSEDPKTKADIEQAKQDIAAIKKDMIPGATNQYVSVSGGDDVWRLVSHPLNHLQNAIVTKISTEGDPIARTQSIGHLMLDTFYVVGTAGAAANGLADGVKDGIGGKLAGLSPVNPVSVLVSIAKWAAGIVLSLASMLLFSGALLAYVFPMVPYMLMLFAVMSWFTSLFIAVVAAPLWAISHATPDGDDAFGSGKNGYVLLMSVVLRPSLTILAMFGSMTILYAMDKILGIGYMNAFTGAQITSATGPIGFIVGILLYCVISTVIVYGCFRLVQTVPDAILQWIGGRDDDSIGVEQHGDKAMAVVGNFNSNAASRGMGTLGGGKGKTGIDAENGAGKGSGSGGDNANNAALSPKSTNGPGS